MELRWMDDLAAEDALRLMAVTFEKRKIAFAKIDMVESVYNGARLGEAIINPLVEDYMQGMVNGCAFPRPVVHQGKGGFVILSGNQRCTAIQRLIKEGKLPKSLEIEAYVVDTTDKMLLEIIARSANVVHGGRSEKDERMAHAVYAVRSLGMRSADAAQVFMVSAGNIQQRIRADKERDELTTAGVNVAHVPGVTLEALGRLDFDQGSKVKLAHLVAQHQPPSDRVKQVVGAVKSAKSDSERLQKIKKFEKELSDEAHAAHKRNGNGAIPSKIPARPRRDSILSMLKRLANFLDYDSDGKSMGSFSDLQIATEADKTAFLGYWKRIKPRMEKIAKGA